MRDRQAVWAVLLIALFASVALLQAGQASFAAATGFSGRNGFTCISCHVPPPDTVPEATLVVEGIPETWEPDAVYPLTIRIEGGPPALPGPAPQGGMEISVESGTFRIPDTMVDLLRPVGRDGVTYTPEGTLVREWQVEWVAPGLSEPPTPVDLWAAGLAANGNHNAQLNVSDGGEHGDRTAAVQFEARPSAEAEAAWRALPLLGPAPEADHVVVVAGEDAVLQGRHADGNATRLGFRIDDGEWRSRETAGAWRLVVSDLARGPHTVDLRSEGADRVSPLVTVDVDVKWALLDGDRATPMPFLAPAVLLLMALALRRR